LQSVSSIDTNFLNTKNGDIFQLDLTFPELMNSKARHVTDVHLV